MSERLKFMGTKSCGCVVVLYDGALDTPRQRERYLTGLIERGLKVEPVKDEEAARKAWGPCPHTKQVKDPAKEARRLLGVKR